MTEQIVVTELDAFKAQLAQALELSDRLITEVEMRDKEISIFQNVRTNLEKALESKENELQALREKLLIHEKGKILERKQNLIDRWVKKNSIPQDQLDDVYKMFEGFDTEESLTRIENTLGLNTSDKKIVAVPITKSSEELVMAQFSAVPSNQAPMDPKERVSRLHEQYVRQVQSLK